MMKPIRVLLIVVVCCIFGIVQCKSKSRGKLAPFPVDEDRGVGGSYMNRQSAFPINAQPMYGMVAQQHQAIPVSSVRADENEMILSRNRNKMIEQLVQELDHVQSPLENEINNQMILSNRDKKSKDTLLSPTSGKKGESETAPLADHKRKNFFVKETTADAAKTCPSQMNVQASTILDSKTSIERGAKFLRVEYLDLQTAKKSLNYAQEECKRLCCEDSECDTALLSMKLSNKKEYRCYLYQCQDLCSMVQHKDFYVFMIKDAEQSQIAPVEKPSSLTQNSNDITTGHDHGDAHSYDMSVDTFENSLTNPKPSPNYRYEDKIKLSDEDRSYFFDKSLASKSSVAIAVIILILGICLVLAFFVYLFVNTKFVAKRIKWIGKKQGKNLDVEADYLINGMYL